MSSGYPTVGLEPTTSSTRGRIEGATLNAVALLKVLSHLSYVEGRYLKGII